MQHINFYQLPSKDSDTAPFNALHMFLTCIFFILFMTLYTILSSLNISQQQSLLSTEKQALKQAQDTLKKIKQDSLQYSKTQPWNDELVSLEKKIKQQETILIYLNEYYASSKNGFSSALSTLSQYHIDGIWLKQFSLNNDNNSMTIKGYSRSSELIPNYIESLAKTASFKEQQFSIFNMVQPKNHTYYEFDLHAVNEK